MLIDFKYHIPILYSYILLYYYYYYYFYPSRRTASASNSRRPIRIVPDWTENAVQGEHYWKPTSASGDLCCLNEECIVSEYFVAIDAIDVSTLQWQTQLKSSPLTPPKKKAFLPIQLTQKKLNVRGRLHTYM